MTDNTAPVGANTSIVSIFFVAAKWIVLLPLAGVLYAYIQWFVPLIPFIPLLPLILVYFAITFLVKDLKKAGIAKIGYWLGLTVGTIILYFAWAVWLNLAENFSRVIDFGIKFKVSNISVSETLGLLVNPEKMALLMAAINKVGTWGLADEWIMKGALLWIFWLLEILTVFWSAGEAIGNHNKTESPSSTSGTAA